MKKYIGMPCEYCHSNFEDKDDVVVCPHCGAPFHRECYVKNGDCTFADKHKDGFSWLPPKDPTISGNETVVCTACNTVNRKDQMFCQMCATRLEHAQKPTIMKIPSTTGASEEPKSTFGQAEDWTVGDVTARDLSAYLGHNAMYFLRQFRLLLTSPLQGSWNWSGFFFTYFYFFYRKLYFVGSALLLLSLLINMPQYILTIEYFKISASQIYNIAIPHSQELIDSMVSINGTFQIMGFILAGSCGLFVNKFILKKAIGDIKKTKTVFGEKVGTREYFTTLFFQGRTNQLIVVMILVIFVVFYFGYLSRILAPYLPQLMA